MEVKYFKSNLVNISKHLYIRFDVKNKNIDNLSHFTDFIHLDKVFNILNGNSYTQYYSERKTNKPFIRIGNLTFNDGINGSDIIYLDEDCSIPTEKMTKKDDIILATIGATIGKLNLVRDFAGGTFSNNTVLLRLKRKKDFNPIFIEKLLQSKSMQRFIWGAISQKAQPNLQDYDLRKIKIPRISISKQNEIADKITPIEQEIKALKESKKDILEIINEVFGEELGFDWGKFEELKKQKIFTSSLLEFSNNIDCRYSYKFHNKAGKYIYDFLVSKTNKRIKDFISEPIVLGKSVSPKDYNENGEYFYIAMSNIKTWAFEEEGCKKLKQEYWSKNLNKTVKKNDIILARSGEGTIGKVALIEEEEIKAVFADFTQRIRLKNYNHRLAYYYFRSDLFQYLVYTHKKGLGNNTNIFPSQIQEFPIPDWSEEKQIDIVEKIKSRIDAQKNIDKQIEEKQNKISELIENAIKDNDKANA